MRNFPVILFGTAYWGGLLDWLRDTVLAEGKISPDDLELLIITDSPERAVQAIVDCFNDECWKVQDDAAKRVLAELADDPRAAAPTDLAPVNYPGAVSLGLPLALSWGCGWSRSCCSSRAAAWSTRSATSASTASSAS